MKWLEKLTIPLTIGIISIICAIWWNTVESYSNQYYKNYTPTQLPKSTYKTPIPDTTIYQPTVYPTKINTQTYSIEGTECIPQNTLTQTATVTGILDGDTIIVQIANRRYSVRYIGINTPERRKPGGKEAYYENIGLVTGKIVTLIQDTSNTDRYGRLLRYVLTENTFVNNELVSEGWAKSTPYPPNIACSQQFTRNYNTK